MSEKKHIYQGQAKVTVKSDRWRVRLLVNEALNNGHMVITDPLEEQHEGRSVSHAM